MRLLYSFAICFTFLGIVEPKTNEVTAENRISQLEATVDYLSATVAKIAKHMKIQEMKGKPILRPNKETDIKIPDVHKEMNDTDLEERVSILEIQMVGVLNDIETIEGDQSVQENRLDESEGEIEVIQADVTSIQETVTVLVANDETIQGSIAVLEQVDQEVAAEIEDLSTSVNSLSNSVDSIDTRLSKLEVDGAVAFHAYLGTYSSISPGTVVVFPHVLVNLGNGYDSSTGRFTVPTGGAGLYYLYVHCMYDIGDWVYIGIRKNGGHLCYATNDDLIDAEDHDGSSCGAVTLLDEGDVVDLYTALDDGDSTPLFSSGSKVNSFTGFRIAPQ